MVVGPSLSGVRHLRLQLRANLACVSSESRPQSVLEVGTSHNSFDGGSDSQERMVVSPR